MFQTELSENCKIGVAFMQNYVEIGARYYPSGNPNSQRVTEAIVRPLHNGKPESGLATYTGVAICSPNDARDDDRGRRVALVRALSQMLPGEDRHVLRLTARGIVCEMYPTETPAQATRQAAELAEAVPAAEMIEMVGEEAINA